MIVDTTLFLQLVESVPVSEADDIAVLRLASEKRLKSLNWKLLWEVQTDSLSRGYRCCRGPELPAGPPLEYGLNHSVVS